MMRIENVKRLFDVSDGVIHYADGFEIEDMTAVEHGTALTHGDLRFWDLYQMIDLHHGIAVRLLPLSKSAMVGIIHIE